jgi:hypothetical protein
LLLEQREAPQKPPDLRLRELIVYLAPGIPPVWRGISLELRSVLQQANHALQGNTAAIAWLDEIHRQDVLDVYARAGNSGCASLREKWQSACEQFVTTWQTCYTLIQHKIRAHHPPDRPANMDELMYGNHAVHDPPVARKHAHLLALAYDPPWIQNLRHRLMTKLAPLTLSCPWLAELGTENLEGPALLVLDSLWPDIEQAVQSQSKADQEWHRSQAEEVHTLRNEYRAMLAGIRQAAKGGLWMSRNEADLRTLLDTYFSLLARVRSVGRVDAAWQDLRKTVLRAEPSMGHIRLLLDLRAERQAANRGWLSESVSIFVFFAWAILAYFFNTRWAFAFLVLAGLTFFWRVWPLFSMTRKIKMIAGKLY